MTAICFDTLHQVALANTGRTPGVSDAARAVTRELNNIKRDFLDTWFGRRYSLALERTLDVFEEALYANSDGQGERKPTWMTLSHALRLLDHIPVGLPAPDVSVDPDGEISFEWYLEPRWTMLVSVSPEGRLAYAGWFGESRIRGSEAYFTDGLPAEVRAGLRRVFSKTSVALRD